MIACNFLLLSFSLLIAGNYAAAAEPNDGGEVQCLHPEGHSDKSVSREYCAYGINDQGDVYFNGEEDAMNLTNAVLKRKTEIGNANDDVIVNLYNPLSGSMAIFYYGCRKCEDLKRIGHLTVSKLRIFLLSLYNQRMKHNIRYSQSDFNPSRFEENMSQPLAIIDVRPFWKNRLILNQTCARKSLQFTQKHFIPAFLTQDICVLSYLYINDSAINYLYYSFGGELTYSMTLSSTVFYQYQILTNSTSELPSEFQDKLEMCKISFSLSFGKYSMRFFCVCKDRDCTLKIIDKNPHHFCPVNMTVLLNTSKLYDDIYVESGYMAADVFLMVNGCQKNCNMFDTDPIYAYCHMSWMAFNNSMIQAYARVKNVRLPESFGRSKIRPNSCMYNRSENAVAAINYVYARYYKDDISLIRDLFLEGVINHVKFKNDIVPVGADCQEEGILADPMFSSSKGANSTEFPCYKYYDLRNMTQIYPAMGITMVPIATAKGKDCYFYMVKFSYDYIATCCDAYYERQYIWIKTLVGCPEGIEPDEKEVKAIKRMNGACPTTISGTNQWHYTTIDEDLPVILCGQFLRGIKFQNGRYMPAQVELRHVTDAELDNVGMNVTKTEDYLPHGCGFDASQTLTLCTCTAALGGCETLYSAGRVHLLRYLPMYHEEH